MIEDESISKVSIFFAILGILALGFIVVISSPIEVTEIGENDIGKVVIVKGEAEGVRVSGNTVFLSINDIKIVKFSRDNIQEGDPITVTGRVSLYKGELEIIADKLEKP